ncbi:RagB/SusD family nutrient uptake outer membrane protein [Flavobacterium sp. MFBS3-15]|uniref:RagB/SusD family nutrient uptake outer membrane protein n=1 Tax=Flavobacterium sp. MFBS3-15 TaxID=2989816 RepID=UPI002235432F|nr:RagB/SusD family nutrient uptake outer membrane protein [Flavobacterium sp. MFBS3-15]MCW4467385.1 RagB/SusD family nutrient uptake outer membrane protein [Flavobacterium sp. MFBS3-15]
MFVACDDAIDITQPSELPPDRVYETVSDMQLGLNGVYASIPGETQIYFTSLFTDETAIGRGNGGQGTDGELAFMLNANSGDAASIWLSNYSLINAANRLIHGVENVVIQEDDPTTADVNEDETAWYNHILAQAHALRAFGHMQLLTYFSEDMTDDSSLGVILVDFVPEDIYAQLPRNTTGEVFALINSDLDFASTNLSVTNPQPGDNAGAEYDNTYIKPGFITAFRARMAAYRGDLASAKAFVDELDTAVYNTDAVTGYNLTPRANYKTIWSDGPLNPSFDEVIFKVNRANPGGNTTGNFAQVWSSINSTVDGSPFFEVNRALFNLVYNTSDIREEVIVDPTAEVLPNYNDPSVSDYQYFTEDILPVGKYPGSENLALLNDIKVFRFSEMVLIRAEYFASIGDFTNVRAQINSIRSVRYSPGSGQVGPISNATDAWKAILNERRIELAFEGHRYVDLRRLGLLADEQVDRDPRDCEFNGFCTIPSDDYRFIMPIPRAETAANTVIQQNPNY